MSTDGKKKTEEMSTGEKRFIRTLICVVIVLALFLCWAYFVYYPSSEKEWDTPELRFTISQVNKAIKRAYWEASDVQNLLVELNTKQQLRSEFYSGISEEDFQEKLKQFNALEKELKGIASFWFSALEFNQAIRPMVFILNPEKINAEEEEQEAICAFSELEVAAVRYKLELDTSGKKRGFMERWAQNKKWENYTKKLEEYKEFRSLIYKARVESASLLKQK